MITQRNQRDAVSLLESAIEILNSDPEDEDGILIRVGTAYDLLRKGGGSQAGTQTKVKLYSFGEMKINVIKAFRNTIYGNGFGLKETKELVEKAPVVIDCATPEYSVPEDYDPAQAARELVRAFQEQGAVAELVR